MNKVPFAHSDQQIYWVMTDTCNFRCSYCLAQNKKDNKISPLLIVQNLYKIINKRRGKWEITISGGEPFSHKKFFEAVRELINIKKINRISLYTNFSANSKKVIKFLKMIKGRQGIFYASLHLEYAAAANFLKKIKQIEKSLPGFKKNLFVHSVGVPKNLPRLKKIKERFFKAGVQFFVITQLKPDLKSVFYTDKQKNFLYQLSKSYNLPGFQNYSVARCNHNVNQAFINFYGKKCSAGQSSFFIDPLGGVYPCLAAKRSKKKYSGNIINNDFKLAESVGKCLFDQCTTPADYNQYFWSVDK